MRYQINFVMRYFILILCITPLLLAVKFKKSQDAETVGYQPQPGQKLINRMGDTIVPVILTEAEWKQNYHLKHFGFFDSKVLKLHSQENYGKIKRMVYIHALDVVRFF